MFTKEELQLAVITAATDRGYAELVQQLGQEKADDLRGRKPLQVATLGIVLTLIENLKNNPELADDDDEVDNLFEDVVRTAYPEAYADEE